MTNGKSGYYAVRRGKNNVKSCIFLFWKDAQPHIDGCGAAVYSVFDSLEDAALYAMVSDDENDDSESDDLQEERSTTKRKRLSATEIESRKFAKKKFKTGISMISLYPRNIRYTPIPPPNVPAAPTTTTIVTNYTNYPLMVLPNNLSSSNMTASVATQPTATANTWPQIAPNLKGVEKATHSYIPIAPHPTIDPEPDVVTDTKDTPNTNDDDNLSATCTNPIAKTSFNGVLYHLDHSTDVTQNGFSPFKSLYQNNLSIPKTAFYINLRKITKYKKEHRNLLMDNRKISNDDDLKELKEWCEVLCQKYDANLLTSDQLSTLRSYKFDPETWRADMVRMNSEPSSEWLRNYNLVKEYKESMGYFVMTETNPQECEMVQWLNQQCDDISKNNIPFAERELLKTELGFDDVKWVALMKSPLEDEFIEMYQKFVKHIETEGSLLITPLDAEKEELMEWVRKTCHNMRRKYMSEKKKLLMKSISGFDPDAWCKDMKSQPSQEWLNKFRRAQSFKEEHGHLSIRTDHEDHDDLVPWLKSICDKMKNGKLCGMKLAYINKLEFSPDEWRSELCKQDEFKRWEKKYQELRSFHMENGHVNLPKGHRLTPWIKDQKHEYKLLMETKESKMTLSKMQKMIEIGFVFQKLKPKPPTWQERLEQLKGFKERHGHCDVRKDEKTGLGTWVINQRYKYNRFKKGERKTNINEELLHELADMGFNFQVGKTPGNWDDWYQELVEYKAIHGHTKVPQKHPSLGRWVKQQRKYFQKWKQGKSSPLSAERLLKLNEIGFVFEVRVRSIGSRSPKKEEKEDDEESDYDESVTHDQGIPNLESQI